jgi:hypothetical protein
MQVLHFNPAILSNGFEPLQLSINFPSNDFVSGLNASLTACVDQEPLVRFPKVEKLS